MNPETRNTAGCSAPSANRSEFEADAPAPDPQRHFDSPEMLLLDATVSDETKRQLLSDWDLEIDNRLNAESEGMGVSDPMSGQTEAKLADISARVKSSLAELAAKAGPQ